MQASTLHPDPHFEITWNLKMGLVKTAFFFQVPTWGPCEFGVGQPDSFPGPGCPQLRVI